jgi:uncharacterized protein YjbJ (UPF0337 family)
MARRKEAIEIARTTEGVTNVEANLREHPLKGRLKRKYGQLTDDDLVYAEGKDDELVGRLEKKLGVAKDKITELISEI